MIAGVAHLDARPQIPRLGQIVGRTQRLFIDLHQFKLSVSR
jgi:hypothetical protein